MGNIQCIYFGMWIGMEYVCSKMEQHHNATTELWIKNITFSLIRSMHQYIMGVCGPYNV
jgi:hypothetical protein